MVVRTMLRSLLLVCAILGCSACGSSSKPSSGSPGDAGPDATSLDGGFDAPPEAGDAGADADAATLPPLPVGPTIPKAPADPLAGTNVESCPVYLSDRCENGAEEQCDVYDTASKSFVAQPDALLRRAYLYDRWYDLYESPDGITAERVFTTPMPGGTPESQWGDPANFAYYTGTGDGAIWTGAALTAAVMRYATTGTQADYQRMVDKLKTLLMLFDVTGVPGYLARYVYISVPAGTPQDDQHIVQVQGQQDPGDRDLPIRAQDQADLPAAYTQGVPDGHGGVVVGTPMWQGHPSIDQYTGPMMAFPLVYNLLQDASLKQRITHDITCYLNRLKRFEVTHLQENPSVLQALTQYFGGGTLELDPGDIDLTKTDTLVGYYLDDLNSANVNSFDGSCPAHPATTPTLTLDATSNDFVVQLLGLAEHLGVGGGTTVDPQGIAHFYLPNIRGGDASHMMHLAAMAYYFTGDDQYRRFLYDDLIGKLKTDRVALTMQAFQVPDWCNSFYGDHITYTTTWQFTTLLGACPLKDTMVEAMDTEEWQKELKRAHNAEFDVMYASSMPPGAPHDSAEAIADAQALLADFGGNDGTLDAPRRTYDLDAAQVIASLPAGTTVVCPTDAQRQSCEAGINLLGVQIPGTTITHTCDGRPGECTMSDGLCTDGMASQGLPPELRPYADYMWQRSPYQLGASGDQGLKQSPGRDLSEPYWIASYYGYETASHGKVLAWQSTGASCP
jgi:hypothetical protein